MNLLVLIHNQSNSGPFIKAKEMCIALARKDIKVYLLCTSKSLKFRIRRYTEQNIDIIETPDMFWGSLRQGADLWNTFIRILIIRKLKIDVVHAIDTRPVVIFPALYLKYFHSTRFVLSWYDFFSRNGTIADRSSKFYQLTFGWIEEFFDRFFRKYADYSIVVTSFLREKLLELGILDEKISTIRVGCNYSNSLKYDKNSERVNLNLDPNKKILCYLGTIFENDKLLLIKSLEELKKSGYILPLTIFIGDHLLSRNDLSNLNISLIGRLDKLADVYKYLSVSDFGLLPYNSTLSNRARWPSKVGDYLCAGLPLISTPISDIEKIIVTNNLGFVSSEATDLSYSVTIQKILNLDINAYHKLSISCKKYAKEKLDWDVISAELVKTYN